MSFSRWMVILAQPLLPGLIPAADSADRQFEQVAAEFMDEFPAYFPVGATALGDHRFDSRLDDISQAARQQTREFWQSYLDSLSQIDWAQLSRSNQVDHALLEYELKGFLWRQEVLQPWAWDPLTYTRLCGSAIYSLMARDFAPIEQRLGHVVDRLEQFPRLYQQIRDTLEPARVPRVHAETAVQQNPGVVSILDNMVKPQLDRLPPETKKRLIQAIEAAEAEVRTHQQWLEEELLPNARGDFRLGAELFDQKLAFTLKAPLTRAQVRERAERELVRVRDEMYGISLEVYRDKFPLTQFPEQPSDAYKQAIIRAAFEMAYQDTPAADQIVQTAKDSLAMCTEFVREKDLVTLPPDPIEIIIMPEFQRGVSLAYCDSPGVLDVGLSTFYAIAPLPEAWTPEQVRSFLREYNVRSIHNLTMHEAMPGHFVQLAHSNRYPGKLRAVLSSGVFIEGWAIYSERVMIDAGLLDHDPLMRLINLKWYLRGIGNAIIDQAIHTEGMTRDQAMRLMVEDTFQEEREAAAKWVRAQLTSAQLSTYFVGTQELFDLRRDVQQAWGDDFDLKEYHDRILSYGSPPTQYVRALVLDEAIPRLTDKEGVSAP
jgi:uncharacterized protein (DUF885 family)